MSRLVRITNPRSSIARAFADLVPQGRNIVHGPFDERDLDHEDSTYLFCDGYLAGKSAAEITHEERTLTFRHNFELVAEACNLIIKRDPGARICVLGSESAFTGSFDTHYASAKAELHRFVEKTRLIAERQQLVAVAPTIIEDSGMTQRRTDLAQCLERGRQTRRHRWLQAIEVARLCHFLLFVDTGSITNTVIRQNGGNW